MAESGRLAGESGEEWRTCAVFKTARRSDHYIPCTYRTTLLYCPASTVTNCGCGVAP